MNRRRKLVIALGAGALTAPLASLAKQAQKKLPFVAYLGGATSASSAPFVQAFVQGLRDLGYEEGKNIHLEYRFADGDQKRLLELATEVVALKPDVIAALAPTACEAVQALTRTIPIVFALHEDPVGRMAKSLARPGGNATGLTPLTVELIPKRLELFRELLPKAKRLTVLYDANVPHIKEHLELLQRLGTNAKLQVIYVNASSTNELERAFVAVERQRPDALFVLQAAIFVVASRRIAEFASRMRLPTMFNSADGVQAGGLISYAANWPDLFYRSAEYVDKILKGTKPGDLPIQQATKFELAINMKTAKALGIKIPNSILVRADKVIE